jgi:N6-L-threonylcarbamoyladenine synthase
VPGTLILGIESSCDETSAAVVRDGHEVLSNVVASQLIHSNYGGVVPELASREHLRAIVPVVREAMQRAGVVYSDLAAVAVTEGPGLAGALLVGISFAKALAFGADLPLIAVNHLEGHIHAVLMDAKNLGAPGLDSETWEPNSPLLALVVSGGHTHLYLATRTPQQTGVPSGHSLPAGVETGVPSGHSLPAGVETGVPSGHSLPAGVETWHYRNIGKTLDDAAGEAFDKVAKLLGLPYPGGPWMDALAPHGDPKAVPFTFAQIKTKASGNTAPKLRRELAALKDSALKGTGFSPSVHLSSEAGALAPGGMLDTRFDLSFSGIKTAVRRYVELHDMRASIEARAAALRAANLIHAKPSNPEALAAALTHFDTETLNLIASFQAAVTQTLTRKTLAAAEHFRARGLLVSGGVAANSELRRRLSAEAARRNLPLAFPTIALSTDNAAMIAAAAWPKFLAHQFAPDTLEPTPQLRLG